MSGKGTITPIVRNSSLELYRIICMLMIVAHHYVVNSGLIQSVLTDNPTATKSIYLWIFGMWGKTGINCFLMITGYFMCKSDITIRKFLKLILEVYLYNIAIYVIFLTNGYESLSLGRVFQILMPVWGFDTNFVSCYIGFFFTIPFLNILIRNMNRRQHMLLLLLLIGMYSVLGNIPSFPVAMNYVTWFGVIYILASFIRLYPVPLFDRRTLWGFATLASVALSMASVVLLLYTDHYCYSFVSDSNKLLPVLVATSSFLWMKSLPIPQSRLINTIGGSTFGVLLIHASSDAMRQWLWADTVDCIGHYSLTMDKLVLYSIGIVLAIFFTCIIIDRIRIRILETPFLKWYDRKFPN